MKFVWDEKKNQRNLKKRKISFAQASNAFSDPLRKEYYDSKHSFFGEDRFILLGYALNRVLFICFTEPEIDTFRIISAREANKIEMEELYNGNG
jgi:uncharacterized DUF497 family protein